MNARLSPLLSAFALLAALPASAAVGDFRLPPGNPTPTPRAQGPVDPEDPTTRPAPAPTPTPSAAPTPAPTPTITPTPRLTLPAATPTTRAPAPRPAATAPRPTPAPVESPALQTDVGPAETAPALPSSLPSVALPAPQAEAAAPVTDGDGLPWGWIVLGLAAIAAAAAGWHFRRRLRPQRGSVLMVPEIEKPRVPIAPPAASPEPEVLPDQALEPDPAAATAEEPTHPLLIAITPIKLTQTFMNEALSYRLTLTNVGPAPLGPVTIAADLAGAHASLSREEQLAGPATQLPEHKTVAGIAPGEKIEVTGDIRAPLADLPVIRQGNAALLVPLARFRIDAPGMETRHFTLAVGQQQPGASGLLPIRLDLGPRTTDGLAGRAF